MMIFDSRNKNRATGRLTRGKAFHPPMADKWKKGAKKKFIKDSSSFVVTSDYKELLFILNFLRLGAPLRETYTSMSKTT